MSKEPIYVNASLPATLSVDGKEMDFPTIQEAKLTWDKLSGEQQRNAMMLVLRPGGAHYSGTEIDRLHYGPKPKNAGGN